jgi:S-methylmethionine-dependent homocysteine/selenocysteine methylase
MEASIVEQLRRSGGITLHPDIVHAAFIYDEHAGRELSRLYHRYIDIALGAGLPFLMCTPTWRASSERVSRARANPDINADAVDYLKKIRDARGPAGAAIRIGGLIGCKNDCYRGEDGLAASDSERFHSWQINQLSSRGVDFLIAETLPNVDEALGIARAMETTEDPYIISFVIGRDGRVLDGTSLADACAMLDEATTRQPLGYMVNCAHPSFLHPEEQPAALVKRLIGYQANASSLDHCELEGADTVQSDDIAAWGDAMLTLNSVYDVTILGGCCGTGPEHLEYLAGGGK